VPISTSYSKNKLGFTRPHRGNKQKRELQLRELVYTTVVQSS
jgi:hypothetical protein